MNIKAITTTALGILCLVSMTFIMSCSKKEGCTDATATNYDAEAEEDDGSCVHDHGPTPLDYHIHIHTPDTSNKSMGDTLALHIDFMSHTNSTVHNVVVQIYNKATDSVIFTTPAFEHVHATSGKYVVDEDVVISTANGFSMNSDWVLLAKVFGHNHMGEVKDSLQFHVNP